MAYLDKKGLIYLWSKITSIFAKKTDVPTALSQLSQDATHRIVTDTEKTAWNNKSNFSGKYDDLSGIPIISNKGYTNGETWYFPLGKMVIDDSGNFGNFTFNGRIGGWVNNNSAVYSIMLMNRANYTGDIITSTVSSFGEVATASSICDIVVSKNSDKSHNVYLACNGYFLFNFEWSAFQHSITYNGTYTTTAPSNIVWRLSTAPKSILSSSGMFTASGGIGGLSAVAASGSYNDLSNKPTIPSAYTHPSTHPASMITGLSTVATSGNYSDLNGRPTILSASSKGYNGAITAGADGVAEMGKYIDFHATSSGTSDYSTRFVCTGDYSNTVNLPSATGTLTVGDKAYKIIVASSVPTSNDTSTITVVT